MAGSWHRILPGTLLLLGAVAAAQKRARPQHRSTAVQRRVLEELRPRAAAASTAATPALLGLLDSAAFQQGLRKCCPSVAGLGGVALLARLEEEVAAGEVTHNFEPLNTNDTWQDDVSIPILSNASMLFNLWTVSYLGLGHFPGHQTYWGNDLEHNLFGFPDFTGAFVGLNASRHRRPASLAEASDRPVYTTMAWNLNSGLGNEKYGSVGAVLSNAWVHNLTLISPVDSGIWEEQCNGSSSRGMLSRGRPPPVDCARPDPRDDGMRCSAWKNQTLGTSSDLRHVLLAAAEVYSCNASAASVLLESFARLYGSKGGSVSSRLTNDELDRGWEGEVASQLEFPHAIKLLVADPASLFGTALGQQLRALCIKWGWVLGWTLQLGNKWDPFPSPPNTLLQHRVLDPLVASHTTANISGGVGPGVLRAFEEEWARAATNASQRDNATALWLRLWGATPAALHVRPMRAGHCSDNECVGRDEAGECVCYL
jgi:hypothetical protein